MTYITKREQGLRRRGVSLKDVENHVIGIANATGRTPMQVFDALLVFLDATKPYRASKQPSDAFCDLCGNPVPDDGFQHKSVRCAACCAPAGAPL